MVDNPRVSIVICFLNAADYIAETIESVLAQTMRNFELLLVDDGSTDASTEIALRYARLDPRIRYLDHPRHANIGLSASRNVGIRVARAAYLATLDADDVWQPAKLEEQCAILDLNPTVALVCGTVLYWSSWNGGVDREVASGHRWNTPVDPPEAMLWLYPLGRAAAPCPSDFLMRRDAVLAVGGFEEDAPLLYEDQAFLAKLYLSRQVYFSDRLWLKYRLHPRSIVATTGSGQKYHDARLWFLEFLEGYIAVRPATPVSIRRALRHALEQYRSPRLHALRGKARALAGRLRRRLNRFSA